MAAQQKALGGGPDGSTVRRISPEFLAFLHDRLQQEGPGDRLLDESGTLRLTGRANDVPLWYHRRSPPVPGQDGDVQAVELNVRGKTWRASWYWESCGKQCPRCTFSATASMVGPQPRVHIDEIDVRRTPAGWQMGVLLQPPVVTWFELTEHAIA
jgi:hypothetical protein